MATKTVGTTGTTTLTGVVYSPSSQVLLPADMKAMNNGILDDLNVAHPQASLIGTGGMSYEGVLHVPNRGSLKILPGDVIAIGTTGWPILISADAAAGSDWVIS